MNELERREFLSRCATLGAAAQLWPAAGVAADPPIRHLAVDCDFPGGNILVERIENDKVYLYQDQRDTPSPWFYWYFRVRGAAGRTVTFHFVRGNVLGVRGPAVSLDGGRTWQWLGAESMHGPTFKYRFPDEAEEVRFCLATPYQQSDLDTFLRRFVECPHLVAETHSTTRKGRITRRLRLGKLDSEPVHRVLVTCRHHSCEMMASWALEGLMESFLAEYDTGAWYRDCVEMLVLPLMDKDGVEDGDQGKNRTPHDHNRDYFGESLYPSVAALRRFVPTWSAGRLRMALDLHCPWIRGGGDGTSSNQRIFLVGNPSPEIWQKQQEFGRVLQQVRTGPLSYDVKHNLPWGEKWNTLEEPRSCSRWAADLPGVLFATTVELPYADVAGDPVTAQSARRFGYDLAEAMKAFLSKYAPAGKDGQENDGA
jgi:hypothetical protein